MPNIKRVAPYPDFDNYLLRKVPSKTSVKIYRVAVNKLVDTARRQKVDKIALLKNEDLLIELMNEQINRTNRSYYKYCYSHMLRWLDTPELIEKLDKIKEPKIQKPKKNIPFNTIKRLVSIVTDDELKLAITSQYDTALRSIDLLNLVVGDLVKHIDGRLKMNIIIEKTREEGVLFLSHETTKLMEDFIKKRFPNKSEKEIINEKIFTITYQQYLQELKKISKSVLGRDITTHWFRMLRATHIAEQGSGTDDVKRQLVVKSDATANRYVKLGGKKTEDIVEPKW